MSDNEDLCYRTLLTDCLHEDEADCWYDKEEVHFHPEAAGEEERAQGPGFPLVEVDAEPEEEDYPAVVEEAEHVNAVKAFGENE